MFGLFRNFFRKQQPRTCKFRCWLCKTETECRDLPAGKYHAHCKYCHLPCSIEVQDENDEIIQSTIGEVCLSPFCTLWVWPGPTAPPVNRVCEVVQKVLR